MRGRLNRRPRPPPIEHSGRHVREQPGRQPDRSDRLELADLGHHRLEAHTSGHRLDHPQDRVGLRVVLVPRLGGDELQQSPRGRRIQPARDPLERALLGSPQRRARHPRHPIRGRRLNPPAAELDQQLLADPIRAALGRGHVLGQPRGQLVLVRHRRQPEPQVGPDLRPVILDRAARPLVGLHLRAVRAHLASDECHGRIRHVGPRPRETAMPAVVLQQQREAQRGRLALAGQQLAVLVEQRPELNQLVDRVTRRKLHQRQS